MAKTFKRIAIDILSGSTTTTPYTDTFNNTTDWSGPSGGFYTISVLKSTHNKGSTVDVHVYENDIEVESGITVDSNGDVTISVSETPDGRFVGRYHINS